MTNNTDAVENAAADCNFNATYSTTLAKIPNFTAIRSCVIDYIVESNSLTPAEKIYYLVNEFTYKASNPGFVTVIKHTQLNLILLMKLNSLPLRLAGCLDFLKKRYLIFKKTLNLLDIYKSTDRLIDTA